MIKRPFSLQTKLILFVLVMLLVVISLLGATFLVMLQQIIEEQIGKQALYVATTIALMPEIRKAFKSDRPWEIIQPLVEPIRQRVGAKFIVVGNREEIRYSHPIPDRIGRKMVGGDNARALIRGESYVSKAVGSLGPSLRGKVPIRDENGAIIGVVSVGFLIDSINQLVARYQMRLIGVTLLAFLVGFLGAVMVARTVKRSIFGLEPEEIASLYKERNAVLESVREGIVVIDRHGTISLVNQAACEMLGVRNGQEAVGRRIQEVFPQAPMLDVLRTGESIKDREIRCGNQEVLITCQPVKTTHEDPSEQLMGVVAVLRLKSEIDQLTKELSQVKRYAEALRAQTHEFHNILYTLSGLIQLGSYREALEVIHKESSTHQELLHFITRRIRDPWIGGYLIGAYNRAKELKVDLILDPESELQELPRSLNRQQLVSIMGNILTNAFEAVQLNPPTQRKVKFFVTDLGKDIVIEIEDSGPGIPEDHLEAIFIPGFSTKAGEKRGYGLATVRTLVEQAGGQIAVESGEWGGARFVVAIPKG